MMTVGNMGVVSSMYQLYSTGYFTQEWVTALT